MFKQLASEPRAVIENNSGRRYYDRSIYNIQFINSAIFRYRATSRKLLTDLMKRHEELKARTVQLNTSITAFKSAIVTAKSSGNISSIYETLRQFVADDFHKNELLIVLESRCSEFVKVCMMAEDMHLECQRRYREIMAAIDINDMRPFVLSNSNLVETTHLIPEDVANELAMIDGITLKIFTSLETCESIGPNKPVYDNLKGISVHTALFGKNDVDQAKRCNTAAAATELIKHVDDMMTRRRMYTASLLELLDKTVRQTKHIVASVNETSMQELHFENRVVSL